jgi:hypothetical protein
LKKSVADGQPTTKVKKKFRPPGKIVETPTEAA